MSESAPRIPEKAVEELAKRRHEVRHQLDSDIPPWEDILNPWRETQLRIAREDLTAVLPLLCGEPEDGKSWTIYACPDPDCEEFDKQPWTNKRASDFCAHANHPEAVRVEVAPVTCLPLSGELSEYDRESLRTIAALAQHGEIGEANIKWLREFADRPLSGELVEEREKEKQRSEESAEAWPWSQYDTFQVLYCPNHGIQLGPKDTLECGRDVHLQHGPVVPCEEHLELVPVIPSTVAKHRAEKAEQELERSRAAVAENGRLFIAEQKRAEVFTQQLNQVREEVELLRKDAVACRAAGPQPYERGRIQAYENAAYRLEAILDSSPSLSGGGYFVGQLLDHPCAGRWELTEHIGGEHDDWRGKCVIANFDNEEVGREKVFHREYMDRTFRRVPAPLSGGGESSGVGDGLRERLLSDDARRANYRAAADLIKSVATFRSEEQWAIYEATVNAALTQPQFPGPTNTSLSGDVEERGEAEPWESEHARKLAAELEMVWLVRVKNVLEPKALLCLDPDQARGWQETGAEVVPYVPAASTQQSGNSLSGEDTGLRCDGSGRFPAIDDALAAEHGTEPCPGCLACQDAREAS